MAAMKRDRNPIHYDRAAYFYLLPALVLLAVFTVYPVINTLITSVKLDYRFLTGAFKGFSAGHYLEILRDKTFQRACFNTAFVAFVCAPASLITALATALLLNSIKKFRNFLTTLYYLPQVTNIIAAGMVFALLFNTNFGFINLVLSWFDIDPVPWISGVGIAGSADLYTRSYIRCLFILFVYSLWQGLSLKVILFLSGLQSINLQYYQAAQIDGTSQWNILRKITFPLLSPVTMYVLITSVITALKSYASVVALFGDAYGPIGDNSKMMITIVGYIIDSLDDYLSPGAISKASAAAFILLLIIVILTAVQFYFSKKWVHYK